MNLNFTYISPTGNFTKANIYTNGYFTLVGSSITISAYGYDLITRNFGNVFYRTISQPSDDFITIQAEINNYFKTNFMASNAFVVTYSLVRSYTLATDVADFQIILSTDSITSYVTINYAKCLLSANSIPNTYVSYLDSHSVSMKYSIVNPCSSTNVNVMGKWIFNLNKECNNSQIQ